MWLDTQETIRQELPEGFRRLFVAETLAREGSRAVPKGTLGQRVHWHKEHRQEFKRGGEYMGVEVLNQVGCKSITL